jgi:hypothetical protein
MPSKNGTTAVAFGSYISHGSLFLSSVDQIEREPALLPYAHYLRQVWKDLGLAGVLCVDGRPTAYLCEGAGFSQNQKRAKQQIVWNQGLVPLLIFLTPNSVEVHSTVKKPTQPTGDATAELPSLIPDLGHIAEALECQKLVRSIETGQFFQERAKFFPPNESVDRCLIENLVHTARKLKAANWKQDRAYSLLGRALFVSFLEARKFIKPDYYPAGTICLTDILARPTVAEQKQLLYHEFFPKLKHEFNGTMFDAALAAEERDIKKAHLDILADFLNAADMKTGDLTLDFWAYDFRYIPVETISAIYEEFLKETDLDKKRRDGAFYTPRHLAETTLHIALEKRYEEAANWKALDPAMGSGIFLVAMFNLLAEQWLRNNPDTRRQTKAQALLKILQTQICGVDVNPIACRIAAFSLYLALFERLQPTDVDEFKKYVRADHFLPPLLWEKDGEQPEMPVVLSGDFLEDKLPLKKDFDLVIGNPPWESRGDKQIALRFVKNSRDYLRDGGVGCLLLPSTILVNLHGSLDGDWFRSVTVEKVVQLADFRFVLFEAVHPCFILRYCKQTPTLEHTVAYETPKLNRFDRRTGVIVVEPDDQKLVPQRDVLEAALQDKLQVAWGRKFWGTARDEAFLRRLDFLPSLAEAVKDKKFTVGVGCQPFYPGVSLGEPKPLGTWKFSDRFLENSSDFPQLVLQDQDFTTVKQALESSVYESKRKSKKVPASLNGLRRKPEDDVFAPPMVVYSKGFTKRAFYNSEQPVRFFDGLRSITGDKQDADILRFLCAALGSKLFDYLTFHSGSNLGIGRDQIHVYESLALPFPLPTDELAAENAAGIVREAAGVFKEVERLGKKADSEKRAELVQGATAKLEPLVEAYYRVTDAERILIEDTLTLWQPSIHSHNLDKPIPSLAFPELPDRERYANTLCDVLNRLARKQGIRIRAESMASKELNLVFFTVIFGSEGKPHRNAGGNDELWKVLKRVDEAAQCENGPFNYLRGFSYFKHDRLYMLKPATMRNWSRTSALNDADAIFEHLNSGRK